MKQRVGYNEIDVGAQRWLRELMHEGLIPRGDIDGRPIQDLRADDVRGYDVYHFFAGIGVWAYALGCAGFELPGRTWTGSCPCQPFSVAGKGGGFDDPRHLWPHWVRLIEECGPDRILGEQSANAGAWLDLVRTDLETLGFAFGCADLPAAGYGGAHIRPRYYWLADADNAEWWADRAPGNVGDWPETGRIQGAGHPGDGGALRWLGDAGGAPAWRDAGTVLGAQAQSDRAGSLDGGVCDRPRDANCAGGLDNPQRGPGGPGICGPRKGCGEGAEPVPQQRPEGLRPPPPPSDTEYGIRRVGGRAPNGPVDWLLCRSGVMRPVEPGLAPLVDASSARVGLLRGYGNALDAEVATQFVQAYMRSLP